MGYKPRFVDLPMIVTKTQPGLPGSKMSEVRKGCVLLKKFKMV